MVYLSFTCFEISVDIGCYENPSSSVGPAPAADNEFARKSCSDQRRGYSYTVCMMTISLSSCSQALYANTSISTGMKGATKAMVAMNKQMAPAKQAKVIREFQKQSQQLDMTIEMMSESIDETLDKDEAEEETEELTNQVLDEIGVDIASQLSSAPKGRIASKTATNAVTSTESADVEELEKRLASLRRI
ncbi:Vacuolar protein sorting-associated protein 2 homolog 2 [Linum perenne]